jgi:hypothetical protein
LSSTLQKKLHKRENIYYFPLLLLIALFTAHPLSALQESGFVIRNGELLLQLMHGQVSAGKEEGFSYDVLAAKQQRKMKMHMAPDNKQHRKETRMSAGTGFAIRNGNPGNYVAIVLVSAKIRSIKLIRLCYYWIVPI